MVYIIEPIVAVALGLFLGAAGGAFNSFLKWLESTDPFVPRKFATAVIQGTIGGILPAMSAVVIFQDMQLTDVQVVLTLVGIFLTGLGVQQIINRGTTAIATRVNGGNP